MILLDANILLYAEDRLSPLHHRARAWLDAQLSGSSAVCLCWTVILAFIRIGTNRRVFEYPLSIEDALARVQSWMCQPCCRLIEPSQRHWDVFQQMVLKGKASANLVSDAHLAALAIEHGCVLCSTDADFARFPKLKWINPLQERLAGSS